MSRILIIGSEGQLGSELSKFLKSNTDSSKIILSDIKEKSNNDLKYFKLNALKSKELEVFVKDHNISEIYHPVSYTHLTLPTTPYV